MTYDPQNVFAKILRGELPALTIYEDDATLAILDIQPQSEGHALVLPKAASRNLLDMDGEALNATIRTTQRIARAARAAFSADGVNVMQFNEPAAGQTVFHTHFHVIPRWANVPLKPHAAETVPQDVLAAHAQAYRRALAVADQA